MGAFIPEFLGKTGLSYALRAYPHDPITGPGGVDAAGNIRWGHFIGREPDSDSRGKA
jgi:hypothetical protein